MTDESSETVTTTTERPVGLIGSIGWALETVADEIIHIGVVTGGIAMVIMQIPVPEWYTLLVGAVVTDYVKKKFQSEL